MEIVKVKLLCDGGFEGCGNVNFDHDYYAINSNNGGYELFVDELIEQGYNTDFQKEDFGLDRFAHFFPEEVQVVQGL